MTSSTAPHLLRSHLKGVGCQEDVYVNTSSGTDGAILKVGIAEDYRGL